MRKIYSVSILILVICLLSCSKKVDTNPPGGSGVITNPGGTAETLFPYVGGSAETQSRIEAIPGRVFNDFNNKPSDVLSFFAAQKFNCVRVATNYGQEVATGNYDNSGDVTNREENFQLDWGGIDTQVELAQRAKALNQKVILTIVFPDDIPPEMQHITYESSLTLITNSINAQLFPFLDAGIQPDIINVGNEAESGILRSVNGIWRMDASYAWNDSVTGCYLIWPKCAGYFKQMILACQWAISARGLDPAKTKFSVHAMYNPYHAQTFAHDIFMNYPNAEQNYHDPNTGADLGVVTAVPEWLRNTNLRDLVDIFCESVYPPIPFSNTSDGYYASLSQLRSDLDYFMPTLNSLGKQFLVLEFGVQTTTSFTEDAEAGLVDVLFRILQNYKGTLGALWWAPYYGVNNWYGSCGSLYRKTVWSTTTNTWTVLRPVPAVTRWGSHAAAH